MWRRTQDRQTLQPNLCFHKGFAKCVSTLICSDLLKLAIFNKVFCRFFFLCIVNKLISSIDSWFGDTGL